MANKATKPRVVLTVTHLLLVLLLLSMKVMTWNVTGLMSSSTYLCDTLLKNNIDVCGISEHFLMPQNVHFIDTLISDYKFTVTCDNSLSPWSKRRVGKGGVALMWHKRYDSCIVPLQIESDRVCGIQFQTSPGEYWFIFQVYLPCSNHSVYDYRAHIDTLYDLWNMYANNGTVVFLGDFNAQTTRLSRNPRDQILVKFMDDINTVAVNDLSICTGAQYTYVSYDNKYHTSIDHICVPAEIIDCIVTCHVLDDHCLNVSRHRPILALFKLPDIVKNYVPHSGVLSQLKKTNNQSITLYNDILIPLSIS